MGLLLAAEADKPVLRTVVHTAFLSQLHTTIWVRGTLYLRLPFVPLVRSLSLFLSLPSSNSPDSIATTLSRSNPSLPPLICVYKLFALKTAFAFYDDSNSGIFPASFCHLLLGRETASTVRVPFFLVKEIYSIVKEISFERGKGRKITTHSLALFSSLLFFSSFLPIVRRIAFL